LRSGAESTRLLEKEVIQYSNTKNTLFTMANSKKCNTVNTKLNRRMKLEALSNVNPNECYC
jgi:hypothetical protein